MNANLIAAMCSDLLAVTVQCYNAAGAPPIPEYQAVVHGLAPPADREQLTVACTQIGPQSTDPRTTECVVVPVAAFEVRVWRHWEPTIDGQTPDSVHLPSVEEITEAALILARDAATVWGLVRKALDGALFPSVPTITCNLITPGTLTPLGPAGRLAGWRWTCTVQL